MVRVRDRVRVRVRGSRVRVRVRVWFSRVISIGYINRVGWV